MKDAFVVVAIGGSQHIVSVADEIEVNRIDGKVGDKIKIDDVFLYQDDKGTAVGTPNTGHVVEAELTKHLLGPKLHVRTYKAKSRYRRNKGHRQSLSILKIVKISKTAARSK